MKRVSLHLSLFAALFMLSGCAASSRSQAQDRLRVLAALPATVPGTTGTKVVQRQDPTRRCAYSEPTTGYVSMTEWTRYRVPGSVNETVSAMTADLRRTGWHVEPQNRSPDGESDILMSRSFGAWAGTVRISLDQPSDVSVELTAPSDRKCQS
jgi:hypothetical protein